MDIHRLETFCRVYERRSFSKAANDLFLSQPTISAHIAALESELGVPLFDRMGRSVLPTQAGNILYSHAQKLIDYLKHAVSEIHLLHGQVAGRLILGGSTIPAHYFLPDLLKRYKTNYPQVGLHLQVGDSSSIEEKISQGSIDIGVIGAKEDNPDIVYEPVIKDKLVMLGQESFFPRETDCLDAADLKKLPWVLRERGSGTRKATEAGLQGLGIEVENLNIMAVVYSTEALIRCLQAGMGISITSLLAAADAIQRSGLISLKIHGLNLQRSFYAVYHKHRIMFPAAGRFLELLHKSKSNLESILMALSRSDSSGC